VGQKRVGVTHTGLVSCCRRISHRPLNKTPPRCAQPTRDDAGQSMQHDSDSILFPRTLCATAVGVRVCVGRGEGTYAHTSHNVTDDIPNTHTYKTHTHSFVFVFVSEEGGRISAAKNMPTRMQKVRSVTRARGHPPRSDVNKPTGKREAVVPPPRRQHEILPAQKLTDSHKKIHSNVCKFP
jgi:hypothetical protein